MRNYDQISLPEFQYTSVSNLNNDLNITKSDLSDYNIPSNVIGIKSNLSNTDINNSGIIKDDGENIEDNNSIARIPDYLLNNKTTSNNVVSNSNINTSTSSKWTSTYRNNKNGWIKDVSQAFRDAGIKNENAIRMLVAQSGLESGWGRSAQGKFNFGNITTGSSWKGSYVVGDDKNGKGQPIKQKFRNYNSMSEFAQDKIQFLKNLYDFDENDDIDTFTNKLKGGNKGKRHYAEDPKYRSAIKGTYNNLKLKDGGKINYNMFNKILFAQRGIKLVQDNTTVVKPIVLDPIKEYHIKQKAKKDNDEKMRQQMLSNQPQLTQYDNSPYAEYQRKKAREEYAKNEFLLNNQHLWKVDPTRRTARNHDEVKREFAAQKSLVNATAEVAAGELMGFGLVKGAQYLSKLKNVKVLPKANPTSRYRNIGNDTKGLEDLFTTGTINPPKGKAPITPTKGINLQKTFNEAFFGHQGKFVDPKAYPGKYFVEADKTIDFIKPYSNQWGYTPVKDGVKTALELSNPGVTVWQRGKVLGVPYMKQIPKTTQIVNQTPSKIPQGLNVIRNLNENIE